MLVKVLAHPAAGSFPGDSHYKETLPPVETVERLLPEFMDPNIIGLDGFEARYPGHIPEHEKLVESWAKTRGLLVTGGSDCHDSAARALGKAGVPEHEARALLARLQ